MGIDKEIESLELEFEDTCELYDESAVKEKVGEIRNGQEIIKIEISSAIFIYREYIETKELLVDVIPFHHIRRCSVVLKNNE
jgi:hypothetical protein